MLRYLLESGRSRQLEPTPIIFLSDIFLRVKILNINCVLRLVFYPLQQRVSHFRIIFPRSEEVIIFSKPVHQIIMNCVNSIILEVETTSNFISNIILQKQKEINRVTDDATLDKQEQGNSFYLQNQFIVETKMGKINLIAIITIMALRDFQQNVKGFISGGIAGVAQVFVMQPFEIVKVRQVNQPDSSVKYHGFIRSVKTIYKEEGFMGLYKGTRSPLIGYGLQCSLQFGYNRFFRRLLAEFNGKQTFLTLLIASILTGIPSAIAVAPADHLRILMQKQDHGRKQNYKGELQAARDILKRHGVRGLYLGFTITLIRQLVAMGLYFSSFQIIKQRLQHDREGSWRQKLKIMSAGSLAGLFSWIVGYPIDFLKTKIQSQDLDNKVYKGIIDCLKSNIREHGKHILLRGLATVCIRSIPVNSVGFLVQEQMSILLGRKHMDELV